MNKPVRVGVVGLGYIGELHTRIFAESARAEVVAVADPNAERAKAVGAMAGAKVYASHKEMLANERLDAVSVCLPDLLHVAVACDVANAGLAVLLEKPVAHDAPAAYRIAEALQHNKTRCQINHALRSDPRYVLAYRNSDAAVLGDVVHVRAQRNSAAVLARTLGKTTSILFYLGVHDVDAVQWLARSQIKTVRSRAVNRTGIANEDAVFTSFEMENGAIGSLEISWAWPDGLAGGFNQKIEIVGTKAAAAVDTSHDGLLIMGANGEGSDDSYLWPEVNGRIGGALREHLENFLIAIQNGTQFVQDWRDGISAVEVLDAIRESVKTGRDVDVRRAFRSTATRDAL